MKRTSGPLLALMIIALVAVYAGCSSDDDDKPTPPVVTKGALEVKSEPSGAQIFVDDVDRQHQTPYSFVSVDSGNHTVKLTKSGYADWTGTVRVPAGGKGTVNATLVLATKGTLVLNSTPTGAAIFIDGVDKGKTTPETLSDIDSGNHAIKLTKTSYADWDSTVHITAQQTTTVNAELGASTYTLDIDTVGQGGVTLSVQGPYQPGTQVELTSEPANDWGFYRWLGDLTGWENPDTVTMNANKNITAEFGRLAIVTGTITNPSGALVHPVAFLDTSHTEFIKIYRNTGFLADPGTGELQMWYPLRDGDSLMGIITGWDDTDGDGSFDTGEPIGWWNKNGDDNWDSDDMVALKPGQTISGADIQLEFAVSASLRRIMGQTIKVK